MKIYMIRHCESEDDVLNCYGGCADFELTEKGIKTAEQYSNKIIDLGIQKIFTSPYKRAKNVGNIFANKIHCEIESVKDLREMNTYGVMSGINKYIEKIINPTIIALKAIPTASLMFLFIVLSNFVLPLQRN